MLQLASTSDLIQVITGSNASIKVHASWVDNLTTSAAPGRTNTAITTASTTTVVGSPSGSYKRNVRYLSVFNNDASASTAVSVVQTDGSNAEVLWKGTLNPGEWVVCNSKSEWKVYSTGGVIVQGYGTVVRDLQVFLTPLRATWTKPAGAKVVCAICIGAGGGGGFGASASAGGGGGGGGAYNQRYFLADDLASTEVVQVGTGGRGGWGSASPSGAVGRGSFFGILLSSPVLKLRVLAGGGGGGFVGATTVGGGGGGGTGGNGAVPTAEGVAGLGGDPQPQALTASTVAGSGPSGKCGGFPGNTGIAEYGGGGGGQSDGGNSPHSTSGGSSLWGGGAGGGGGGYHGLTPFDVSAPSDGGSSNSNVSGGGGAAGTSGSSPTNGTDGSAGATAISGNGGGGGGSTITAATNGANGGNGGQPGGGGGGGGTSKNGTGGNGGNGGDGAVYVFTW